VWFLLYLLVEIKTITMNVAQCYGSQVVHSKGVVRESKVLYLAFYNVDGLATEIKRVR